MRGYGRVEIIFFSRGDHSPFFFLLFFFFKVRRCAAITHLFLYSVSRCQLRYTSIHFLQATEVLLMSNLSMGIGQGYSAHFTICRSLPHTIAQHHVFPINISWMSKFCPEKNSYKTNKCMGKNLSFVNNTCMRYWAAQNGKGNSNNKAEMLDHGKSMWSHTTY